MNRKPDVTQAYFLTPGTDPHDINNYRPCTVHSMTPKHYNITYATPEGKIRHVRCCYATIYNKHELLARTSRSIFTDISEFLRHPSAPAYSRAATRASIDFVPVIDDDAVNMLSVIRCALAAAEEVVKSQPGDTWRDWCCDLLNTLPAPAHPGDGDSDDFLLRVQCALTSRIENGHW